MELDDVMKALNVHVKAVSLKMPLNVVGYIVSYMVGHEIAQEIPINFVFSKGF